MTELKQQSYLVVGIVKNFCSSLAFTEIIGDKFIAIYKNIS